jgi:hypothetical protein
MHYSQLYFGKDLASRQSNTTTKTDTFRREYSIKARDDGQ